MKINVDNSKSYLYPIGLVVALWLINWICLTWWYDDTSHRGTFGDMFGAVNALFSGLAFAGIIYTILLQRNELALQREELKLTRSELTETRKEFELQNQTLLLQRFDNTFFNMINLHHQIIDSFSEPMEGGFYKGRDALQQFINIFSTPLRAKNIVCYLEQYFGEYLKTYSYHVVSYKSFMSHYLQSLASIYVTINDSDLLSEDDKKRYNTLLKSYISTPERRFLYYHLILANDDETTNLLRRMEKELRLIHNLPIAQLMDESHHALISKFPI